MPGNAPIGRAVHRIVAVQQIEPRPSNDDAPNPQLQRPARQLDRNAKPAAARLAHRLDRHDRRIVVGKGLELPSLGVDHLAEIALLVQQADPDDRNAEVARRLQEIARQHAKPAGVKRQRLAETKFHAEPGDAAQRRAAPRFGQPAAASQIGAPRRVELIEMRDETGVRGKFIQTGGGDVFDDGPWIARRPP